MKVRRFLRVGIACLLPSLRIGYFMDNSKLHKAPPPTSDSILSTTMALL
jgi:hypothetical protein